MGDLDERAAADSTRRWVSAVVVGLNLCPFARRVSDAGRVRYVVPEGQEPESPRVGRTTTTPPPRR